MLMAVDIGNTNIVIGFLEGDRIVGSYRITTKATHTSDEYGLMITQFLALSDYTADDVDDVIVCSVVPKVMYSFRASLIKFLGLEPMVVGPGVKTGMNIRLDDPKTLGSDCIADCAGAYHTYGGPVLVAVFAAAGVIGAFVPFVANFFALILPTGATMVATLIALAGSALIFALCLWLAPLVRGLTGKLSRQH